jgi:hypothetical protein
MVERCGYAFYGLFALKLVAVVPEELISPRLREYEVSELDWVLSFCFMQNSFQFLGADAPLLPHTPTFRRDREHTTIYAATTPPRRFERL